MIIIYVVRKILNNDNIKFMYYHDTIDIVMLSLRYIMMMIVAVSLSSSYKTKCFSYKRGYVIRVENDEMHRQL